MSMLLVVKHVMLTLNVAVALFIVHRYIHKSAKRKATTKITHVNIDKTKG